MEETEEIKELKEKIITMCGEELGSQIIKFVYQIAKIDDLEKEIEILKKDVSTTKED